MKNLDIDSENTNTGIDASQRVKIEFIGGHPSEMVQSRATACTVIVPYNSFSKKLQTIHRSGGKIINISIPRFQIDLPKVNLEMEPKKDTRQTLEEVLEPVAEFATKISADQETHNIVETSSEHVADNSLKNDLNAAFTNDFEETVTVSKVEPKIELAT